MESVDYLRNILKHHTPTCNLWAMFSRQRLEIKNDTLKSEENFGTTALFCQKLVKLNHVWFSCKADSLLLWWMYCNLYTEVIWHRSSPLDQGRAACSHSNNVVKQDIDDYVILSSTSRPSSCRSLVTHALSASLVWRPDNRQVLSKSHLMKCPVYD